MSWPYSQIKTAVTGDILTATDYNNEHQNHITNNDPVAINDSSATVTAMKATTDPGESGSESLAVTLDGEIQRLRFALVEIKGTSFWYQTPTNTLAQMLPLAGGTLTGALTINPATNQLVLGGVSSGKKTTITAPAPAADRVVTIPDGGADSSVVLTQGSQTIVGDKTLSGTTTLSGTVTASSTIDVTGLLKGKGTATNDSAAAGYIGQLITASGATVALGGNNTYTDIAAIALTAGDWDVSCNLLFQRNGATWTQVIGGIGTATGNASTGLVAGDTRQDFNVTNSFDNWSVSVPVVRVSLSAGATYYLKGFGLYSVANPNVSGRISARRVR